VRSGERARVYGWGLGSGLFEGVRWGVQEQPWLRALAAVLLTRNCMRTSFTHFFLTLLSQLQLFTHLPCSPMHRQWASGVMCLCPSSTAMTHCCHTLTSHTSLFAHLPSLPYLVCLHTVVTPPLHRPWASGVMCSCPSSTATSTQRCPS
jgi:hypothetical protein